MIKQGCGSEKMDGLCGAALQIAKYAKFGPDHIFDIKWMICHS